ncbi:MAG: GNAT family N-acetyltransferase [Betaproteobacteria bacterium]|nr:GNAT family N-acetyltransferase [Betaproteobacteria bacterium]
MDTDIEIAPLGEEDIAALVALTRDTWNRHYPSIISQAQIDYMLDQRYRPELIRAQLGQDGIWWDALRQGGELVAFAQYERAGAPDEIKLDKLYVRYELRGQGHGGLLLQHVENEARSLGARRLYLQVNKKNVSAIRAYEKQGFRIAESAVFDIGNGFVMDDYVMEKALAPIAPAGDAP